MSEPTPFGSPPGPSATSDRPGLAPAPRHFRVDPRLVHATVMSVWVPTTGARIILIVDGQVARDPKRRAILEASAMGGADVRFANEAAAAELLGRCPTTDVVLVLFSDLEAAERALHAGVSMQRLVIGHLPQGPGRTPLHPSVHIGPEDHVIIQRLELAGVDVLVQALPSDKAQRPRTRTPSMISTPPPSTPPTPAQAFSTERRSLRVVNQRGLHLRAAHALAQLATNLECEVTLGLDGEIVNGKSLLGIATLGATCGTWIEVETSGVGAGPAMGQIERLFESGFGEGVEP